MQLGVCASTASVDGLVPGAADFVEENVQSFLVPEEPDAVFVEKLRAVTVPVRAANGFLPGTLKCVGPAVDQPRLLRYAESAFLRAQQAGIGIIVFGSGNARQVPARFDPARALEQFVALVRQLGPLAQRHGLVVAVEPLGRKECNFINSLAEGAAVVAAVAHPRVRLLADTYHMAQEGESPEEIRRHGRWLAHVHVAEHERRTAPGVAGDDFRPLFCALRAANYHGAVSVECMWQDLKTQLAGSLAGLRQQWEETTC